MKPGLCWFLLSLSGGLAGAIAGVAVGSSWEHIDDLWISNTFLDGAMFGAIPATVIALCFTGMLRHRAPGWLASVLTFLISGCLTFVPFYGLAWLSNQPWC